LKEVPGGDPAAVSDKYALSTEANPLADRAQPVNELGPQTVSTIVSGAHADTANVTGATTVVFERDAS
jgi:hypothetical protein